MNGRENCEMMLTVPIARSPFLGPASGSSAASGATVHRKLEGPDAHPDAGIELFRNAVRFITVSGLELGRCQQLPSIDDFVDTALERFDTPRREANLGGDVGNRNYQELIRHGATAAMLLIGALGGDVHTGMCLCPAHHDQHPSLHISTGDKQNVIWKCHAGCSQGKVLEAFKTLGLWPLLQSAKSAGQPRADQERERADKLMDAVAILRTAAINDQPLGQWGQPAAPTDYLKGRGLETVPAAAMLLSRASAGKLRKVIPGFKAFPAMVLPIVGGNGLQGASVTYLSRDGGKTCAAPTARTSAVSMVSAKVVTQLGEIDPEHPPKIVLVAEGIENALAASQLTGHPAIAVLSANNYAAAGAICCQQLILCGDNDKSGLGRKQAEAAASVLALPDRSVRIAIPPDHKDWNDAIRDREADPEQLRRLLLRGAKVKASRKVCAVGMENFMQLEFPPRQFLLKPWLTTTGLAMIDAPAGQGKTWLALSIGYAVASGRALLEWPVDHRGKVLYVDGELPGELLQVGCACWGRPCRKVISWCCRAHSLKCAGR